MKRLAGRNNQCRVTLEEVRADVQGEVVREESVSEENSRGTHFSHSVEQRLDFLRNLYILVMQSLCEKSVRSSSSACRS